MKISQSYLKYQFDFITKVPLIVSNDHINPKISIAEFKNQYETTTTTTKFVFQIEKTIEMFKNTFDHLKW
jgi:hypothetical protein